MSTDQTPAASPPALLNKLAPNQPIAGFFAEPANRHGVATNIDLTGLARLRLVMRCTSQPDWTAESLGDSVFKMKYFYAHSVEMVEDKSGEVFDRTRLVLIDDGGKTISFVSEGAIDSLDLIRSCFGDGPYVESVPVVVTAHKTRRKNTVLRLEVAPEAVADEKPIHRSRKPD